MDVHKRFMVIDVSEEKNEPHVFINPEIVARDGGRVYQEGCLSVPGIFADVTRARSEGRRGGKGCCGAGWFGGGWWHIKKKQEGA